MQGTILWANAQTEKLFHYAHTELVGKPVETLLPEYLRETHARYHRACQKAPQSRSMGKWDEVLARTKEGTEIPVEISLSPWRTSAGPLTLLSVKEISAQRRAEHLWASHLEAFPEPIFSLDEEGRFTQANPAMCELLGYGREELLSKKLQDLVRPREREIVTKALDAGSQGKNIGPIELTFLTKNGRRLPLEVQGRALKRGGRMAGALCYAKDLTKRIRAEAKLAHQERFQAQALTLAERLSPLLDEGDILEALAEEIGELFAVSFIHFWKLDVEKKALLLRLKVEAIPSGLSLGHEVPLDDPQAAIARVARSGRGEVHRHIPQAPEDKVNHRLARTSRLQSAIVVPLSIEETTLGVLILGDQKDPERFSEADLVEAQVMAHQATSALHRARLYEELKENALQLQFLSAAALRLSEHLDLAAVAEEVVRACVKDLGVRLAWLGKAEPDGRVKVIAYFPLGNPYPNQIVVRWDDSPEGQGPTGRAIRSGSPEVTADISSDPRYTPWRDAARAHGFWCSAALPLTSRGRTFGALNLYSDTPGFFTPKRLKVLQAFANQAAAALENARLYTEAQRGFRRIQALRNIDMAITSSLDPRITIRVLLDEVVTELEIDAAAVLLLDPQTLTLEYAGGRGFRTRAIQETRLRLGQGYAGRAVKEHRTLRVEDLSQVEDFPRQELLEKEGFVAFHVAPMISKRRVLGVLEIFHRSALDPDEEWTDFLEALAAQAAIAMENANLFSALERSNLELRMAYEATLEGWARALELRDWETKGHTQRVVALTVRLAQEMGMSSEEIVHVRRGALLHDIGKLSIPDSILLKPGKLTEEEWQVMRQHPQYALEMLSEIEFLRPALDIPYCHHERWDGQGYPRGLKGEEIPLSARIFAVVDAWDAMTSDRPYHKALSREEAIEELIQGSGKQFDPAVVKAFLKVLEEEGN